METGARSPNGVGWGGLIDAIARTRSVVIAGVEPTWTGGGLVKAPRTLIFAPGNRQKLVESAAGSEADEFVVDFEDSVPGNDQSEVLARANQILTGLERLPFIRVDILRRSLDGQRIPIDWSLVAGLVLPDTRTRSDLDEVIRILGPEVSERLRLIVTIESALGLRNCYSMLEDGDAWGVIFAGAPGGDLCRDLHCAPSASGIELLYARSKLLLDARASGVSAVIDGVFPSLDEEAGFESDCLFSRRLGFDGRCVIHPRQVAVANRAYSPTTDEVERAKELVAAAEAASEAGLGAVRFRGGMVDSAMVREALQTIERWESLQ